MAFSTAVWSVDGLALHKQERVSLDSEKRLEEWIVGDLSLLGEDLLLIDQQVRTTGGPLDVLAMDADGALVIAELKRDRTPREVVAQVLDYASWLREQTLRNIEQIFLNRHRRPLADAFRDKFDAPLPESAAQSHRMLVVAAELDDSSERIIRYLQDEHEIDINAVFFSVYRIDGRELLVRAWLADPAETHDRADRRVRVPWSGVWYVNQTQDHDWELRGREGFISAGNGEKYSRPLHHLQPGDPIAIYQRGKGYLATGVVRFAAITAADFCLRDGRPLCEVVPSYGQREPGREEHVVGIDWTKTVGIEEGRTFDGVFANQNVVCKLRHAPTLTFLAEHFGFGEPALTTT